MSYGRGRHNRSPACLYVGNLPDDIKEHEIEDLFRKFGKIRDIDIKRGRNTTGTAYCFVDFYHVGEAEEAIERRHNYDFAGNRLRVEFTGERRPRRKDGTGGPPTRTNHRVIVTNLPAGCCWQHLKDHMRAVGDVGYANIENKKGIVEYLKYDDMLRALEKLEKSELHAYDSSSIIKVRRDEYSVSNGNHYSRRYRKSPDRYHSRRSRSDSYYHHRKDRKHYSSRNRSPSRSVDSRAAHRSPSRENSYYSKRSRDASHHSHVSEHSQASHHSNKSYRSNASHESNNIAIPMNYDKYGDDNKGKSRKTNDYNEHNLPNISPQQEKMISPLEDFI